MRAIIAIGLSVLTAVLFSVSGVYAKLEVFKAEKLNYPGLKCVTCHISVPTKADIAAGEKLLNDVGKFYRQNKTLPPADKK